MLGLLLDRDGPEALGAILAELGERRVIDNRVLLAHRLGADEAAWPAAGGPVRAATCSSPIASRDPWLRDLTRAAAERRRSRSCSAATRLVGPGPAPAARADVEP